jgi:hypothetical protein
MMGAILICNRKPDDNPLLNKGCDEKRSNDSNMAALTK